jgi:cyclopropane-fatty-acyl-phospholipid synthase
VAEPFPPSPLRVPRRTAFQSLVRRRLHAALARLRAGELELHEGSELHRFGATGRDGLRAHIDVRDPAFYSRLARGGTLGGAESWMRGEWEASDLTAVLRMMARDADVLAGFDAGLSRAADPARRLLHWLRRNSRRGAQRNIAAHYDLGNEFFSLFLDPTLTYSCGVFERADATMEEASLAKYDRLCRKLALGPDDHVLEIGTGWGGFCVHAASRYGCRVTSTTISAEQRRLASERVAAAGVADRVTVLGRDYRDLEGCFDKLVSIEMIEAVGAAHLPAYFRACGERLAPGGRAAIQAIVVPDQQYERARRTVDFIKRYVFPGGHLPSIGALVGAAARASDLRLADLEEITPHYAETLRRWRDRFLANVDRVRRIGYPERFVRMWEYYLRYCEAGFEERTIAVVQLVFERPTGRAPAAAQSAPA